MELPKVKVGQVWKDKDYPMSDRHLRVIDLPKDLTDPDAKCTLQPCDSLGKLISTQTTRILIRRMKPTSNGFVLVRDINSDQDSE